MSDLRAARLTGVLFIIATVANLLGAVVRPGLAGTDYLGRLSAEPDRVAAGSLLLLIAAFACAGLMTSARGRREVVSSALSGCPAADTNAASKFSPAKLRALVASFKPR